MVARSVYIQKGGKGEAVRRKMPSGEIQDVCLCWYNVDCAENCIAQVDVELLQEVINHRGSYAPGHFDKLKVEGMHDKRCEYCYTFKNTGNVFPREVNLRTENDFKKHQPKVIRLGKLTEPGHPYFYNTLMGIFDLCLKYNAGVIFPTKMFPFGIEGAIETEEFSRNHNPAVRNLAEKVGMVSGQEIAGKLKSITQHTLSYSIGYDCMEPGAISQGFTNRWRINQAIAYHKEGINTSLTIVCDLHQSIEANVARGSAIKEALDACREFGINPRLLPIRIKSEKVAMAVTGKTRRELLYDSQNRYLPELECVARWPVSNGLEQKPYRKRGNQEFAVMFIHDDFKKLIENGMGVCGSIGLTEYCDGCNLDNRRISFSIKEIPKVIYNRKEKRPRKKKIKTKICPYLLKYSLNSSYPCCN